MWGPVFEAEGRFSKVQPVPLLGNENSTQEKVEAFYNFWYNFDSWRSFEYQDEDVPDDNENRDQKRHVERKNANARKKKKTEDTARLRHLVDDALALDQRIKKFRQEQHAQKNKKRLEKEAEEKRLKEEAAKAKEEEARMARQAEEVAKAERVEGKKAKEAAKNAAKKNKRVVRNAPKEANYFVDGTPDAKVIDQVLNEVDLVIAKLENEELALFTSKLHGKDKSGTKAIFSEEVRRLIDAGKLKENQASLLL